MVSFLVSTHLLISFAMCKNAAFSSSMSLNLSLCCWGTNFASNQHWARQSAEDSPELPLLPRPHESNYGLSAAKMQKCKTAIMFKLHICQKCIDAKMQTWQIGKIQNCNNVPLLGIWGTLIRDQTNLIWRNCIGQKRWDGNPKNSFKSNIKDVVPFGWV